MEGPPRQSEEFVYPEPSDVLPSVLQGECGIRQFHGQIAFYVPNDMLARLGAVGLYDCLLTIYGAETSQCWGGAYQHPHSLLLELPPQLEKVQQLMSLIDQRIETADR